MRVALIGPGTLGIPPRGWGATQRVLWNLHRSSQDAGFETVIVNPPDARALREECESARPDVLHLHAYWRAADCLAYLEARPTPLVLTFHDARLTREIPLELMPSIELADAAVALSPAIRERLEHVRRTAGGVHYVANGVDTSVFRPLAKRPNTVAAVGKNTPRKRFAEVARFFAERPEYRLTMCGPDMRARIGDGRPVIPTAPNIELLDDVPQDAVARLLGESEYFVHLADEEACALVIREAMACACRVWTTRTNAQDLSNVALSWEAAVADPALGSRAAREAGEAFDWSIVARRHAAVYATVLERWRGSPTSAADARRRYRACAAHHARLSVRLPAMRRWVRARLRKRVATAAGWTRRLRGG